MKGYVQVYTGNGKGKTTAALGLALRAAGAGMKVFVGQFIKSAGYSEHESLSRLAASITVRAFGRGCFITGEPEPEDIRLANEGLQTAREALQSGVYGLVILDEANVAVDVGLFSADDLLSAIRERAPGVEVVVTGRKACTELLDIADLVTEMVEVKHYYRRGVKARKGIES